MSTRIGTNIMMRKIISFMHISLDSFVADPNGEMNRIKVDEKIFDHVGWLLRALCVNLRALCGKNKTTKNTEEYSTEDAESLSVLIIFVCLKRINKAKWIIFLFITSSTNYGSTPPFTHRKKKMDSLFREFLMLFLAVTLGFFVENQREHYIEHVRAKEFSFRPGSSQQRSMFYC